MPIPAATASITGGPWNQPDTDPSVPMIRMPAQLYSQLLGRAQDLNAAGLKAFGLLIGDPRHPHFPYQAADVVLFDPRRNRRNEPANRAAFHGQGSYFRAYEDAGFVADPTDLLREWQRIERRGLEPVAAFHVHRRQPANLSIIDYRLHNPAFTWHLIISLRYPSAPDVRPFLVRKEFGDLGIDESDDLEGSELSYPGPEVTRLGLQLSGSRATESRAFRGIPARPKLRLR